MLNPDGFTHLRYSLINTKFLVIFKLPRIKLRGIFNQ